MRKRFILISLILCFIATTIGCEDKFRYTIGCAEIESGKEFSFYIISDPHYLSKKSHDEGLAFQEFLSTSDGKMPHLSEELIDVFTVDIIEQQPDFLIIPGDLTCNGGKKSHLEFAQKLKTIENNGTCVFVIPGNHDIMNPWANKFVEDKALPEDSITVDEFKEIYKDYGYDQAISHDTNSLSYLAMPTEDNWLLMIDSSISKNNMQLKSPELGGLVTSKTLTWIEQCAELAKENNAKLIAVMHHSLLDHSKIVNTNYTVKNSDEILKIFNKYGISLVLTAHIHVQDIKSIQNNGKIVYDIATSCLSGYPHQYGKIEYIPNSGYNYSTVKLDVKKWAAKNNKTDEILLNFNSYAEDFFVEQCCEYQNKYFSGLSELSEEDKKKVINTMRKMNMMYFAGYRNEALSEMVKTEGFKILKNVSPCFIQEYAMSMLNDERDDNNKFFIPIKSN